MPRLTGTLKFVQSFDDIAMDIISSDNDIRRDIRQIDSKHQDYIAGSCYIQCSDGQIYRVHPSQLNALEQTVPEIIEDMLWCKKEVSVSFEIARNTRGINLWAKNLEIVDLENLIRWAESRR